MKTLLAGLALICMPVVWLLGIGIYLFTIYIGFLNGLLSFICRDSVRSIGFLPFGTHREPAGQMRALGLRAVATRARWAVAG